MKILRDKSSGTITMVAATPDEADAIRAIQAQNAPLSRFRYDGRKADPRSEAFTIVTFRFGDLTLEVSGTEEKDCYEINNIRNVCYFAPTELTVVGYADIQGQPAITVCLAYCQHCQRSVTSLVEAEWRTCDACAARCEHDYKMGAVHGGVVQLGYGEFCQKCGRSKPKSDEEPELSLAEQHVLLRRKLGLWVVYRNTPLTPEQIVELERRARDLPPD